MAYSLGIFGLPGSGKSTIGLSHPGKLLHWIFGSTEDTSQRNFIGRTDFETVKFTWMDTLKPDTQAKFLVNPLTVDKFEETEMEKTRLSQIGKAKNVAYCWYLLRQLRDAAKAGKAKDIGTVFLDNFTPFSQELEDYVQVTKKALIYDKDGEIKPSAYGQMYRGELQDFLHDFCDLSDYGIYAVFSCHVGMNLAEEVAATTKFFDLSDPKKPTVPREWQPLIMGKSRFQISSIPDYALFTEVETPPGLPTKFLARLEPNSINIGVGKPRIQPFVNPRELQFPKNQFYHTFNEALEAYKKTGIPVTNPTGRKPA